MPFSLKNVSYTYQKGTVFAQEAIREINLTINDGEILAILGATGSGKSTLLQLLNGLLIASQGIVIYNNRNLATLSRKELVTLRQQVGMVFQYPEQQIFADRVYDEIAFGPLNLGLNEEEVDKRVRESMLQVGLDFEEYYYRQTKALSSGEKRRVALAGILALKPRYLLLDEPTAGLDFEGRRSVINCLQELNQRDNITIIFVTHHLQDLYHLCKRLLILDKGEVKLDISACELWQNYNRIKELEVELPPHLEVAYQLQQRGWHLDTKDDIGIKTVARQIALNYISRQEQSCSGV